MLISASCNNSEVDIIANLNGSAPYSFTASLSGIIFPKDFDIFLPSINTLPLTIIPFGQSFFGNKAV